MTFAEHKDPFAVTFGRGRGAQETDSLVSRVYTDKAREALVEVQRMRPKEQWTYVINRLGAYPDFRERPILLALFEAMQRNVISHYHGNQGRYMRLVLQAMEIRNLYSNRVVVEEDILHIWPKGDVMPLDKKQSRTITTACGHEMEVAQENRVLIGRWSMPEYTDQWHFPKRQHICKDCAVGADTLDERHEVMRRPKLSFSQDGVFLARLTARSEIVMDNIIATRSWSHYSELDFAAAILADVWPQYVSELAQRLQGRIVKDIFDAKLYAKYHKRGADGYYEKDTWLKVVEAASKKAHEVNPSSNHFSVRDVQAVKRVVRYQLCEQLYMNEPAI